MKLLGGLARMAISAGVYLNTRHANGGQMIYVMWGPGLMGVVVVLRAWLED